MPKFAFTLTRTRLQSRAVVITARTEHEAEGIIAELAENGDSDLLTSHEGVEVLGDDWSDGEDEGSIDYDYDGEAISVDEALARINARTVEG